MQHIGAPAEPVVKPRQAVRAGELLGDAKAFVCAPVHSPLAGVAEPPTMVTLPNGRHVPAIPVTAEGEQLTGEALWDDVYGGDWPSAGLAGYEPQAILQAIRGWAGGHGGAGFPTHVKLTPNPPKPVDTLIVNGCECEPYLTSDYRLMLEAPKPILLGALLAAKAAGAERVVFAVEDDKLDALEAVAQAAGGSAVEVVAVQTKYPMGGERQLLVAAVGRAVPTGGLPLDVGVVVVNVATAAAIARAVVRGKPLTHRVVTVSGAGVNRPCNVLAPVGMSYAELLRIAGGLRGDADRVVAGGPMMGFAVSNLDLPITKGTGGVTVLTADDVAGTAETPCVRCGALRQRLPAALGALEDRGGQPTQELGAGPAVSDYRLHGMRLLRVCLSGADSAGAGHPRRQGHNAVRLEKGPARSHERPDPRTRRTNRSGGRAAAEPRGGSRPALRADRPVDALDDVRRVDRPGPGRGDGALRVRLGGGADHGAVHRILRADGGRLPGPPPPAGDGDRRIGHRDRADPGAVAAVHQPVVRAGHRRGGGHLRGQDGLRRAGAEHLQPGDGRPGVPDVLLRIADDHLGSQGRTPAVARSSRGPRRCRPS